MKTTLIILSACVLASCTYNEIAEVVHTSKYIKQSEISFTSPTPIHTATHGMSHTPIKIGEIISLLNDIDRYVLAYPADYPADYPIFMADMSIKGNQQNQKCTSSITGTSSPMEILNKNEQKIMWGRMDAWDGYGQEGWEYPANWEKIICNKDGSPRPKEVYVLCAEKDEKTVVICINQMTDNPQLAEDIFKTFRWLD